MLASVDTNELQYALGGVVLEAGYLERALHAAFSALVGSKYAAVVAGNLMEAVLIEDCQKITKYHTDLSEAMKQALLSALKACDEVRKTRNRIMHDAWATRPGGIMVTLQANRDHEVTITARTTNDIHQLADELGRAADNLNAAMTAAFGIDWSHVEDQLRQELGHDISTDSGS